MFDVNQLREVIELHHRSYELLRWVGRNLRKGMLDFSVVHRAASAADAAQEWISRHWSNLPVSVRPAEHQLEQFARMFASYLTTSFTLVRKPGRKVRSDCGCYCSYCAYLGQADHLQVRSPSRGAKRAAQKLKSVYVVSLAEEESMRVTRDVISQMCIDPAIREPLALATYGRELVRRMEFASQGEAVLALWREFAWTDRGSPKPRFRLDADEILKAERVIVARMSE